MNCADLTARANCRLPRSSYAESRTVRPGTHTIVAGVTFETSYRSELLSARARDRVSRSEGLTRGGVARDRRLRRGCGRRRERRLRPGCEALGEPRPQRASSRGGAGLRSVQGWPLDGRHPRWPTAADGVTRLGVRRRGCRAGERSWAAAPATMPATSPGRHPATMLAGSSWVTPGGASKNRLRTSSWRKPSCAVECPHPGSSPC